MLHDIYIIFVPQLCSLASATLPHSRLMSQKAASFLSSAVSPPCSRMLSPSVEHFAACVRCIDAPLHIMGLSPHGGRREPADLLSMQLDVDDNGGGWLYYQASKFNSRRCPTLGYFVIDCSAATTPHWSKRKLEAGRRRKRLLKATDATRYRAARSEERG